MVWLPASRQIRDKVALGDLQELFVGNGGLLCLTGNLGRSIIKVSALNQAHCVLQVPAIIFDNQASFVAAFKAGLMAHNSIVVLRFQGP
jgi:phosphogluconate dehydratase